MTGSQPPHLAPTSALALPRRRLDRYELIAEIARGGMGTVLLARLAGAGGFSRLFAIKLLHPHLAEDPSFVHMLLDEARLASRIHHSNAVPIVDVCQSAIGLYVVMDYVEGFAFHRILAHDSLAPMERMRLSVHTLLGVLAGLDAAHDLTDDTGRPLGLVHRDVSPQNVLVGLDGVGRIADFGIAHAGTRVTHTEPGTVKGKIPYMSPEQACGERLDRRTDVFAVGVMLWESLTGRRLFKGDGDAATLLRLLRDPILAPSAVTPGVPAELDAVCLRALERDLTRRHASAHDMAAELSRAAERAGCLAGSIEVADLLRARFGEEIAEQQAAIRLYAAALAGGSVPVAAGELPALPKLTQRARGATPGITPSASSAVSELSSASLSVSMEASGSSAEPARPATRLLLGGGVPPLALAGVTPRRRGWQLALAATALIAAAAGTAWLGRQAGVARSGGAGAATGTMQYMGPAGENASGAPAGDRATHSAASTNAVANTSAAAAANTKAQAADANGAATGVSATHSTASTNAVANTSAAAAANTKAQAADATGAATGVSATHSTASTNAAASASAAAADTSAATADTRAATANTKAPTAAGNGAAARMTPAAAHTKDPAANTKDPAVVANGAVARAKPEVANTSAAAAKANGVATTTNVATAGANVAATNANVAVANANVAVVGANVAVEGANVAVVGARGGQTDRHAAAATTHADAAAARMNVAAGRSNAGAAGTGATGTAAGKVAAAGIGGNAAGAVGKANAGETKATERKRGHARTRALEPAASEPALEMNPYLHR